MKCSLTLLALAAVLAVNIVAAKNCQKVAKKASKKGLPVPTCDGTKFASVQCADSVCICAKETNGKSLYKKFQFPEADGYDCSQKPSKCQTERNQKLIAGDANVPNCDANGDYIKEVEPVCTMVADYTTNIALNRPTMQSSEGWAGAPARAVDGNSSPAYSDQSCSHTMDDEQAWWVVDLGDGTQVTSVSITNRQDACCVDRLADFQVGLTDTDPNESAPTTDNYNPCASVSGVFGDEATRSFTCEATGRYLVVQLQGTDYLTLCEVKVFGVREVCE